MEAVEQATSSGAVARPERDLVGDLRGLVENIVKLVVDHPEAVRVEVSPSPNWLIAHLYTDPRDVGQVIGRNAHLITSVRSFVAAFQGISGKKMTLNYVTEHENRDAGRGGRKRAESR